MQPTKPSMACPCSLQLAAQIEWESALVWEDRRRVYDEVRFSALGLIGSDSTLWRSRFAARITALSRFAKQMTERCTAMSLKTKTGKIIDLPDAAENAAIEAVAALDSDAPILSEAEWAEVRPRLRRGGRPKSLTPKVHQGLRLSPEVLAYFRATGKGWQTRIDEALKEWIASR